MVRAQGWYTILTIQAMASVMTQSFASGTRRTLLTLLRMMGKVGGGKEKREKRGRRRGEGEGGNIGAVSARLESRYVRSPKAGRRPMPAAGVVIYFVEVSSSQPDS